MFPLPIGSNPGRAAASIVIICLFIYFFFVCLFVYACLFKYLLYRFCTLECGSVYARACLLRLEFFFSRVLSAFFLSLSRREIYNNNNPLTLSSSPAFPFVPHTCICIYTSPVFSATGESARTIFVFPPCGGCVSVSRVDLYLYRVP